MSDEPAERSTITGDDVLATLARSGPEYGPVLAHRLGVPNEELRRRCRSLAAADAVERVTEEPLYRLTERGQQSVGAAAGAERRPITN
ncbi:hypothetical protein [Halomicrobium salinisoli]|uniref:hypothetical protein n=1 Tax=Halomicrobium salinisoli TaxID=2878391 RepID=UPI001CF09C06|nr:hypothetical protein [Halomicrobium salinisoli]